MVADRKKAADLIEVVSCFCLTNGTGDISQGSKYMLSCPGAMTRLADEVEEAIVGQQRCRCSETEELSANGTIPTPRLKGEGRILDKLRQIVRRDKLASQRQSEFAPGILCCLTVVNEHTVPPLCPKSREETKVMPQIASCVWRGKVIKIRSKRQVMLRIKNVYFHRPR